MEAHQQIALVQELASLTPTQLLEQPAAFFLWAFVFIRASAKDSHQRWAPGLFLYSFIYVGKAPYSPCSLTQGTAKATTGATADFHPLLPTSQAKPTPCRPWPCAGGQGRRCLSWLGRGGKVKRESRDGFITQGCTQTC